MEGRRSFHREGNELDLLTSEIGTIVANLIALHRSSLTPGHLKVRTNSDTRAPLLYLLKTLTDEAHWVWIKADVAPEMDGDQMWTLTEGSTLAASFDQILLTMTVLREEELAMEDDSAHSRSLEIPTAYHYAGDDLNRVHWLRQEFRLLATFDGFCNRIAECILAKTGARKVRADRRENLCRAISVIVGNLFHTYQLDQARYLLVQLSNKAYPEGPYNPLKINIKAVRDVVNYFQELSPAYVTVRGGNLDRKSGRSFSTRLKATKKLIGEISGLHCLQRGNI